MLEHGCLHRYSGVWVLKQDLFVLYSLCNSVSSTKDLDKISILQILHNLLKQLRLNQIRVTLVSRQ